MFQLLDNLKEYEPKNINLKVFKKELEKQLRDRFKAIFQCVENANSSDQNSSDFCWFIATFLDPFFKIEWLKSLNVSEENKEVFINNLKKRLFAELIKVFDFFLIRGYESSLSAANWQIPGFTTW